MRNLRRSPPRLLTAALALIGGGACVPPEARTPVLAPETRNALVARPETGLAIRPARSGGRAAARTLGTLATNRCPEGQSSGGRDGTSCFIEGCRGERGFGIGGSGGAGFGIGRIGTTGRGGGSGHGQRASTEGDGVEQASTDRAELETSPFAWAEITLPYRTGLPARFDGRPDARINTAIDTSAKLLSTFAIDVDTASYSMVRRAITSGALPEPSVVRVEELVNYFHYDYEPPANDHELFAIEADGAASPVDPDEHVLRIGLQARLPSERTRLPANLVFLVDTSCSMTADDRLPLAKKSLAVALDHLAPTDHVAITTYAGGVSLVLPPTPVRERARIEAAIAKLAPGGGTAMASGLELAYRQASRLLDEGTITRIIVLSDGDANIGATKPEEMLKTVASYVSEGVKLSTIGFGEGNYQDAVMENLADHGNGNYFYVDSMRQAERVFGRDLERMIQDVAEDVKIQVEFDGSTVRSYRLIGYENRALADRDFRNDRVDAGEIGAGHQVTALYALHLRPAARGKMIGTVRVRAKRPHGMTAKEIAVGIPVRYVDRPFERAPQDLRTAVAVMATAELLRRSPEAKGWSYPRVLEVLAKLDTDTDPDRRELVALVRRAALLHAHAGL